jgi:hypothetical protein
MKPQALDGISSVFDARPGADRSQKFQRSFSQRDLKVAKSTPSSARQVPGTRQDDRVLSMWIEIQDEFEEWGDEAR